MPSDSRNVTNRLNSDSGWSRSATVVNGTPVPASQAPAWSQFPMCGQRQDHALAGRDGVAKPRTPRSDIHARDDLVVLMLGSWKTSHQ